MYATTEDVELKHSVLGTGHLAEMPSTVFRSQSGFVPSKGGDGGTPALHACGVEAPKPVRRLRRGSVVTSWAGQEGRVQVRVLGHTVPPADDAAWDDGDSLFGALGGSGARALGVQQGNARRVLNCCDVRVTRLYETADPFDRAHARQGLVKVGKRIEPGIAPAARKTQRGEVVLNVRESRPRLYPRSQMTSRGVSIDSAFDQTAELIEWMKREGLTPTLAEADPLAERVKAGAGGGLRGRTRR